MIPTKRSILTTAAALLIAAGGGVSAKTDGADANARLAFSDKLNMYSQRIVGSACAHSLQDAPFESRGFLAVAGREINRILIALEKGDPALGISSVEENENILELLKEIKQEWGPVYTISHRVLSGDSSDTVLEDLEKRNADFSENALRLVGLISNQYTDADSLQLSDSVRLQVAGRQRTLSQKLSFEACQIQKTGATEARAALSETVNLFELSAGALRTGMPEVGLIPTDDPVLVVALDGIDRLWSELKWPLMALEQDAVWDKNTQSRMYLKLNELMHEMDKVVIEYTKAAKLNS